MFSSLMCSFKFRTYSILVCNIIMYSYIPALIIVPVSIYIYLVFRACSYMNVYLILFRVSSTDDVTRSLR